MPLPKVKHPIFEFSVPSTGKKESFRPFLVKEEKLLLMAKTSEDPADALRAVKQVVNNCSLSQSFNVDALTMFDLEYLFLQLRAVSVSNVVKVSYMDNDDQQVYDFQIDLKDVTVEFPDNVDKVIKINDEMGMVMRWPSAALFDDREYMKSGDQAFYELVVRCIDKIYDGDEVFDPRDYGAQEIEEFLDSCGFDTFEKVQKFMASVPRLYHRLEYTNSNGKDRVIELTSLTDFFTLR